MYLQPEDIMPTKAKNSLNMQLGKAEFIGFKPNDGGYVNADNGGYQLLSNFPKPSCKENCDGKSYGFRKVSLKQILKGDIPKKWIEDRIVLIGATAPSLQDLKQTPYFSSFLLKERHLIAGVELKAYFLHEIISAALEGRTLLKVLPEYTDYVLILLFSWIGVSICSLLRFSIFNILFLPGIIFTALSISYLAFLNGWWIPVVSPSMTLVLSLMTTSVILTTNRNEQKQLRLITEFVINNYAHESAAADIAIEYLKHSENKQNQVLIEKCRRKIKYPM